MRSGSRGRNPLPQVGGRGRDTTTVRVSKQAACKIEESDELLPGIPNELTVNLIVPKLPWITFYSLSLVCHSWQRVIKSRQVYDARVSSKSTQTLVAIDGYFHGRSTIALYSTEDDSDCYHLPPIPYSDRGNPRSCECISLDGKLYALGGSKLGRWSEMNMSINPERADVYVFDVAGQRQWEKCASMIDRRSQFGCGVIDRKIYVFGGSCGFKPVGRSEVYDPKEDAWSPITRVSLDRIDCKVTTLGEELFLHSGMHYASKMLLRDACFAEVYHPLKNEWRIVDHFTRRRILDPMTSRSEDIVLTVGGKLYRLNLGGIQAYDMYANSWSPSQPISFGGPEPSQIFLVDVVAAVGVDDEVLAIVHGRRRDDDGEDVEDEESEDDEEDEEDKEEDEEGGEDEDDHKVPSRDEDLEDEEDETDEEDDTDGEGYLAEAYLIRSQGVGGENTEIVWETLECPILLGQYSSLMCPIQL